MKKVLNIISILVILLAIGLWIALIWPWYIAVLLIIARIVFLLVVSAVPQWNYYVNAIHNNPNAIKNTIALTFDDGPSPHTEAVLDVLKTHNMKATFFCIGKHIEKHPDIFKRILAEGHEVGNHTYSHSYWLGFFSTKRLRRELELCDLVAKEHRNTALNYYRPPYGITNPMLRKTLKLTEHRCVCWNKRSYDTMSNNKDAILNRLTTNLKTGDIVLQHDTLEQTPEVLEKLLNYMNDHELRSVTVSQLLNA